MKLLFTMKLPFAMRPGIAFGTCVTDVLLRGDGVLVVVDGGNATGWTEKQKVYNFESAESK